MESEQVDVLAVMGAAWADLHTTTAARLPATTANLLDARDAVAELIAADREFDAVKVRKIQADNRVICGGREDDDYRRQADAQHAFDRAIARRAAALARIAKDTP